MNRPIHFEYQKFKDFTVVALDSKLSDYGFQPVTHNREMMVSMPAKTVKDCRHIDGCVYFHLGHVTENVMIDLIEKFNKLKKEKGWKQQQGLIVPDHKFKID